MKCFNQEIKTIFFKSKIPIFSIFKQRHKPVFLSTFSKFRLNLVTQQFCHWHSFIWTDEQVIENNHRHLRKIKKVILDVYENNPSGIKSEFVDHLSPT